MFTHDILNLLFYIFSQDKGKYEMVQGMLKLADDMIEVYADLINRYPAIIALIDPFKKQVRHLSIKTINTLREIVTFEGNCLGA